MRPLRRSAGTVLALCAVLAGTAVAAGPADAAPARPGATGGGDSYFPRQGNGGYDVRSYNIAIGYLPRTKHLAGRVHIIARATQRLSRFDLDLRRNLHVSRVWVNGHPARFAQPARLVQELVITPRRPVARGAQLRVAVRYAGTVKPVSDPDGSPDGFIPTSDGAFVASEPQGSPTWFPVNDTPRDKARYAVSVTVPRGLVAVSNGFLVRHRTSATRATWAWHLGTPVSSYLVTASIGKFQLTRGRTPRGVPYLIAVDPTQAAKARPVLRRLPAIVDYFTRAYGPYPFGIAGAIVDNAPTVGYALETATRPVFDRAPDLDTLAHELAHQWFGDKVTARQWRDIWVNEGFAEFSAKLWAEHDGGRTTKQYLAALLAKPASDTDEWLPPPGNPGSGATIFADSVYDRGAATLAALRGKLGDRVFFRILRGWLRLHAYGNGTVGQFTAYAEKVAKRDLTPFFREWLYRAGKPRAGHR